MNSDCNFYVFREGRQNVAGERLLSELRQRLGSARDEAGWTDALLCSGVLECALEDVGSAAAGTLAKITDACSDAMVCADFRLRLDVTRQLPESVPGELTTSTPEGFAYYALHPMQYADAAERLGMLQDAVVVGIRSIGTTLSAVMAAALRRRGTRVDRFSVRPQGHPFERTVEWRPSEPLSIQGGVDRAATFVVVDEGPGLSGSSFLAVAEGLHAAGVLRENIVLVPSYSVKPAMLRAKGGEQRWGQFRSAPIEDGQRPQGEWIGGGEWRGRFLGDERTWPGAWTSMERAKFLSREQGIFWKFEGLGPYGARSRQMARALAGNGLSPRVLEETSGFIGYELLPGTPARREDLHAERVGTIASYCAFRAQHFRCDLTDEQQQDLVTMLKVNFEREFGDALPEPLTTLPLVRPIVCDAKMLPHEWLITEDGRFLKLDAVSHGDDHFFPGPCDVAWDLAGAIVEWEMDAATRDAFLLQYESFTGDDASGRIANYLRAYAVFRFAWSKMAAAGMKGTPEESRLMQDYQKYRAYAERAVSAYR